MSKHLNVNLNIFNDTDIRIRLVQIVLIISLSACSLTGAIRSLEIRGLEFRNNTGAEVFDVTLKVKSTREKVYCNAILKNSFCSTTFPLRQYQGNAVIISWADKHRKWNSGNFVIEPDAELDKNKPAKVLIVFQPNGRLIAKMKSVN